CRTQFDGADGLAPASGPSGRRIQVMDICRFGIKLFTDPMDIALRDFVPVFHSWIQKQVVPEHLLIDVHDYSHIWQGPGVLLVAHEGNFSIDIAGGRLGLLYHRKQPRGGTEDDRLITVLTAVLRGCALLEDDPRFLKRLQFKTDHMLVIANDRLHAPNQERTFAEMEPALSAAFRRVLDSPNFTLTRGSIDPKERFTVLVQARHSEGVKTLVGRIC